MDFLKPVIADQPYPLIFAVVSGAHLYGFPSPDSDYDLRGVHVLPPQDVIGLYDPKDTLQFERIENGIELDLVTHDLKKFMELLLGKIAWC